MTETGIASGLQRLVEDINTTVPPRTSVPKANGNGNGEHSTDLGVENIKRAGELSAQTFRDAFEETARRHGGVDVLHEALQSACDACLGHDLLLCVEGLHRWWQSAR